VPLRVSDVTCSSLFAHIYGIARRKVQVDVVLQSVVPTAEISPAKIRAVTTLLIRVRRRFIQRLTDGVLLT
jgi:hypothetical protein